MALACTGRYQQGFGAMPAGVRHVPADQLVAEVNEHTAAVLVEPVQGEGGCVPLDLSGLREACDAVGALLIQDEVQCGLGRTGELHHGNPHVRTLAKALGGGLPLGAVVSEVDPFVPGDHGSTFGGNPVSCAAACATLEVIETEGLVDRCQVLGDRLRTGLEALGLSVTGRGLMLAAQLGEPAGPVVERLRERGVLTCAAGNEAVRFLPAFTSTEAEIDELIGAMR
jgi:acetylornithine/succinyldiaminopimelate/putrescine aminotransferase